MSAMSTNPLQTTDSHDSVAGRLPRRAFLQQAALAAPLASALAFEADAAADEPREPRGERPFPGVIVRQHEPPNLEFPFDTLNGFITSNEQFYVRTHFPVPEVAAKDWTLKVEGHVEKPFEIGYAELTTLKAETIAALLECAGNGRIYLKAPQIGLRWAQGGVSNAEWTGVRLWTLLDRAGVKPGAVDVILEGHDHGTYQEPNPRTPGEVQYARSVPIDKARRPEVLLAWQMNGQPLPPLHGFPVRAIVAGWYGMASVKWLKRIVVTDRPYQGFFQTFMYTIWERRKDGLPALVPVTEIAVKSQIARPTQYEVVSAASSYRIFGAAWSGESPIAKVEISTDGGKSWEQARLDKRSAPFAWRLFEYEWRVPSRRGRHVLMSRATDDSGQTQPLERDNDRRDAMITHVQRIEVDVR